MQLPLVHSQITYGTWIKLIKSNDLLPLQHTLNSLLSPLDLHSPTTSPPTFIQTCGSWSIQTCWTWAIQPKETHQRLATHLIKRNLQIQCNFHWVFQNNCLSMGYVIQARLPCLASVGEEVSSPTDTWCARVGGYPQEPQRAQRRSRGGMRGRIVGGGDWKWGSEWDVKWINKK